MSELRSIRGEGEAVAPEIRLAVHVPGNVISMPAWVAILLGVLVLFSGLALWRQADAMRELEREIRVLQADTVAVETVLERHNLATAADFPGNHPTR